MSEARLDPVTYEVVHHKLLAITEEQRLTFQSISGSPVVTEASDYFTGLFTADGRIVTMGYKVATQGGPMTLSIGWLRELFAPQEIAEGDVFLANDPYRCAVHQNDVQVLAPLFTDGQLAAWAGFGAHEVDVGGMDFASWCPQARDVFQEGIRIPGVKLVDRGRPREDVWRLVLAPTRLPQLFDLDLRGMVAAAHVSQRRLAELAAGYGAATVQAAMERMIAASERRMRARLASLPDGRYRAVDFLEHDGHEDRLYRVALTLTKHGEELELDFTESADQAPGFVNCTRAGLRGGVVGALFPALAGDIPWNEGLLAPVTVVSRPGSLCDARFPAPVGAATVEAVWVVKNVTVAALSRLKACSGRLASEVQAVSAGTMSTVNLGGLDQYGQRYGIHLMDPMLNGFGAWDDRDGYEVGGSFSTPVPNVANVESNELLSPMLYLHRRLLPDTAGAGRRRGGVAGSMAFTAHGVDATQALIMTHGLEVPNSAGLFGGQPGSCVRQRLLRGSDLAAALAAGHTPTGVDELQGAGGVGGRGGLGAAGAPGGLVTAGGRAAAGALGGPGGRGGAGDGTGEDPAVGSEPPRDGGASTLGPKPGLLTLRPGDVFETSWQGGGGLGDPLDREPEAVAADVAAGLCSIGGAWRDYGVRLSPAAGAGGPSGAAGVSLDLQASEAERRRRRAERLAGADPPRQPAGGGEPHPEVEGGLGGRLVFARRAGQRWFACACGQPLAPAEGDWKAGCCRDRPDPAGIGPGLRLHPQLELRRFLCPGCGASLGLDVAERGAPDLRDIELAGTPS